MAESSEPSISLAAEGKRDSKPKPNNRGAKPKRKEQGPQTSQQGVSAKLRGLPKDSPEVRISKTLSYILRHGAEKEGLKLRTDGYTLVDDLVS